MSIGNVLDALGLGGQPLVIDYNVMSTPTHPDLLPFSSSSSIFYLMRVYYRRLMSESVSPPSKSPYLDDKAASNRRTVIELCGLHYTPTLLLFAMWKVSCSTPNRLHYLLV
jgi:hypothetical protein